MNIRNFLRGNDISNPPWDYYFLLNLEEKEYPRYLAKLFKMNTGENLPLKYDFKNQAWIIDKKRCKTFNQKIQWIKLYGVTDLMRKCTDKVAVREFVREKIGEEYLKPVLQICDSFDEIDFDKLPNAFVIKCSHGCKWHYIIKNKEEFLKTPQLFETVKRSIIGWLEQEYWCWGGFEMQYRGIESKILIEPLLRDDVIVEQNIQVYVCNNSPEYLIKQYSDIKIAIYDKNLQITDDPFGFQEEKISESADKILNQIFVLSKKLAQNFIFVRVDWIIYKYKLYFEELTFTPYSGFFKIRETNNNKMLSSKIILEENKNGF